MADDESAVSGDDTTAELKRLNTQVAGLKVDIQQIKELLRTIASNTRPVPDRSSSYQRP